MSRLDVLLNDWKELNRYIMLPSTTEAQVLDLLEREKAKRRRESTLGRVYSRYSHKRKLRERAELAKLARNSVG